MIYEVRTYTLKPGSVAEFEENFGKALPNRAKVSPLGAFFHSDIGPLNQVIHIWPYESMEHREEVRGTRVEGWPPPSGGNILNMESEIWNPAEFMRPMSDQALGGVYEMRTYTYQPGAMGEVLKRWAAAIPHREEYSPLAAGMYSELGGLNRWMHVWPYKDLSERDRIRAEAATNEHWPPPTREFLMRQENKILIPAAFSPMH
ncbi:MAG: NIPSNAP family protein [Dehalococcoidia bacterium]